MGSKRGVSGWLETVDLRGGGGKEWVTLDLQSSTGPPPGRGLDQLLHLGQRFPRLTTPLLRDVSVEQVFPKRAVSPEVDDNGLPSTTRVDHELDAWDFLQ